ncbi:MAG: FAD-binding protein, partial [Actinomycetota bacterium]|nr:FAD-binding protein [Actinomycetota bacterium]
MSGVDVGALAADLRAAVVGEVRFDRGSRGAYSTDASNYRQIPIGVVLPRDNNDVVAAVAACRRHGAPIVHRGGGTSLAGQATNAAVVIDGSKYLRGIIELDPERRRARVQPGVVLDDLRDAAERHGLTFGPDPATHNHCTLGGMIGNNACGVHSVTAGRTADNVEELDVVCYDGTRMRVGPTSPDELAAIVTAGGRRGDLYRRLRDLRDRYADLIRERFPHIPRRVSGYNLDELLPERGFHVARALVGTEGTCVTVLEATVRLVDSPPARALLVLGYPDVFHAGDHVPDILRHGPVGLEGIDDVLVGYMEKKRMHPADRRMLPEGGGWLLVEFAGAHAEEADEKARALMEELGRRHDPPAMKLFDDPHEEAHIWSIRESGLGATARVPGERDSWPGWEDSAVPPDRVGDYLRGLRGLLDRYGYDCALYGHFGDGCTHVRIDFELGTADGLRRYRAFVDEAAELVVTYGGSLSGEHGDGQARAELLAKMFGPELVDAFAQFKALWDPDNKMNPGKVVAPYRLDQHLKLGTGYAPAKPATHFAYPQDDGDFARATLRCVGVGKCRRTDGGTMCPSYMVTLEEEHSTRGRARLLFEMLQGDSPVDRGWRSDAVRDALDLCLACKACKRDCPVGVDMATYKAEFLSHHYQGRLRPRSAYAMGLIHWAARAAARMPDLANLVSGASLLGEVVKRLGGVAGQRQVPRFARETFTQWFARRESRNTDRPRVLLWPDTFNTHFHPEVAKATVEVLEACGYRVDLPPRTLCCGRPLYDYGMLTLARRQLRQILQALRADIAAGVPLVGMEPSCLVVFRDELVNLLPHDGDARRLQRQAFMLTEFLADRADEIDWPALERKAVVHGHCHQSSIIGMDADLAVFDRLGLDCQLLDSGCCGMAGSFGFEKDHYDVSVACAERVLLPAARTAAAEGALVVTSGFSCREQLRQLSDVPALHTHELLR